MRAQVPVPVAIAFAVVGFICVAALSYLNRPLAVYAVLTWSVLVIAAIPTVGWALMIFAGPIQNLFAITSEDFLRIRAILFLTLTVRLWPLLVRRRPYRWPMPWFLVAFAMLVGMHDTVSGSSWKQLTWDTSFFLALAAVYIISREFGAQASGMTVAQTAMVAAALTSGAVSFLFLYLPLPGLIASHPSLDNLRLFGVQDGPNALAKLLLPSLLFLVVAAADWPRASRWAIPLLMATGFMLAATGTRTVLVAALTTLFVFVTLLHRPNTRAPGVWVVLVLVLLGYLAWTLGAAPWVERHAARQWIARSGEWNLCYYLKVRPSDQDRCSQEVSAASAPRADPVERIRNTAIRDLRLQESYSMTKVHDTTAYERRPFSPLQMGQRDRTWAGGLQIVARHWRWGIGGNEQWARHMQQVVGYPFSSPHNGLVEALGGYGVLGLLLYLSVVGLFVRNYLSVRALVREPWQRLANEWTFMCGVAVFIIEMTDILIVLAFSIHAIWFWVIAGLQAGLRDAVESIDPRPLTPSARSGVGVLQP